MKYIRPAAPDSKKPMRPAALANRNEHFPQFRGRSLGKKGAERAHASLCSVPAFCSRAIRASLFSAARQIRTNAQAVGDDVVADKTKLFTDAAFNQAEVVILLDAYVRACRSLHDTGQPDIVTDVIAERLITLARAGQWDPQKLSERALGALSGRELS